MKTKITILSTLATFVFVICFAYQTTPWVAPAEYDKKANPVKSDEASIAAGKALWTKNCQSCHGKTGMGDGPKAAGLKTPSGDFTTEAFQKQSDGSIFYKTSEGRNDMPSFKKKIPDQDDIWNLVNYIRTLKK